jgi:hypothetical protein
MMRGAVWQPPHYHHSAQWLDKFVSDCFNKVK